MSNYSNQNNATESSLPIWALVLSFLSSPVGAILGHVAMSQMKSGQISSANRGMALAAVILGWTFTALALLIVPILLGLFVLIGFTGS
jgi:hypothetical protein